MKCYVYFVFAKLYIEQFKFMKRLVISLISIVVFLCSCSSVFSSKNSDLVKKLPVSSEEGTVSYSLLTDSGEVDDETIYNTTENKFHKTLFFENHLGYDCDFTLLVLKNYEQTSFNIMGQVLNSYVFSLSDKSSVNLNISIEQLSSGYNDMVFLVYPFNAEGNTTNTRINYLEPIYLRFTIFSNSKYIPSPYLDNSFINKGVRESEGLSLSRSIEDSNLIVHFSSKEEDSNYALVIIKNNVQMLFPTKARNIFFSLEKLDELSMPVLAQNQITSDENNVYTFIVIRNPYNNESNESNIDVLIYSLNSDD